MLNESIPTASASTASSTVLRMTASPLSSRTDSSTLMGTNESNPNSMSWALLISGSTLLIEAASFDFVILLAITNPSAPDLLHMQVLEQDPEFETPIGGPRTGARKRQTTK